MIYVYFFIKSVVKWSVNSVRFEFIMGIEDGPNSEILSQSVRYGMYSTLLGQTIFASFL